MNNYIRNRDFSSELKFIATRSSGPGGQNVNKVSSKIELRFSLFESEQLSPDEKERIAIRLKNRINNKGELIITSQNDRSQVKNKINALEKFYELLESALKEYKARKATKPTKASVAKRVLNKKLVSEKKRLRRKDNL